MSRRCLTVLSVVLAWWIVTGLVFPSAATAGQPWFMVRKQAPEPRFHPEQVFDYDPYGRHFGLGVPTYNWGYFGARHRPSWVYHKDYYGDYVEWSFRPGY